MIDHEKIEATIVNGLQSFLEKQKGKPCAVIMANQVSPTPPYPYVSYTVTSPLNHSTTHYSVATDGTRYKSLPQVWSFTVQSDGYTEAMGIALLAFDYFAHICNVPFQDAGIVVQSVGGITSRDNLISIEYEHRNGFDVTFLLMHTIDASMMQGEAIDEVTIANNIEDQTLTKED